MAIEGTESVKIELNSEIKQVKFGSVNFEVIKSEVELNWKV